MYIVVVIFHLLVCFILMGVVLLQAGKGAEMGAAFGGSSQTIFGSRGGAPFLSNLTIGAAAIYMITSLTLSMLTKGKSVLSSVADQKQTQTESLPKAAVPSSATATPAQVPVAPATATPPANGAEEKEVGERNHKSAEKAVPDPFRK